MNALVTGTATGAGLLAGIFLALTIAVVPGLHDRPAAEAAGAMRAINRAIVNPIFGTLFVGTGLAAARSRSGRWSPGPGSSRRGRRSRSSGRTSSPSA